MPQAFRSGAGIIDAQVKSPGPTKIHCRMMPMAVLANQYRPTPAGLEKTIQPNTAGIIQSIIWFICCCCEFADAVVAVRPMEMRCCSHIDAPVRTARGRLPLAPRSTPRNVGLSGTAFWMKSTS